MREVVYALLAIALGVAGAFVAAKLPGMSSPHSEIARPAIAMAMALEKEKRRREQLKNFKSSVHLPGHPIADLLEKKARYKVFYGGRGAIKSWGVAEALIERANTGYERILCAREYQNSIKDSVHKLLCDTIERMGLSHRFHITQTTIRNTETGSEFIFKGLHHNFHEIKSMEGITICWVEEAQLVGDESWMVLIPTIRVEGSEIWVTFNTTDEDAATYKRFVTHTPPNAIVHKVNYDSNPYFPKVLRDEMEYLRKIDVHAYEHVWLGHPLKLSDAIIFGGKYRIETFPDDLWKRAKRLHFGADFGYAVDPATLIRYFTIENTLYIEYEAWKVKCDIDQMPKLYDTIPESRKWPIKGDEARPETISYLRKKGFRISAAAKWKGSVEDGIAHIRGFDVVIIHPRCVHTAEEARLYSWKKDANTGEILPIIVDRHNHCWDAVRYGLDGYIKRRGAKPVAVSAGSTISSSTMDDSSSAVAGSDSPWGMHR